MNLPTLLATIVAATFGVSVAEAVDVYYPSDATIGGNISGNVIIGYSNASDRSLTINGTSPDVGLVAGSSVQMGVDVFNASTLTITGGSIGYGVDARNFSLVLVSGGTSGQFHAHDSSRFDISGGANSGGYRVSDNGLMNFNGSNLSTSLVSNVYDGYTFYQLHGTLQSGQSVENNYLFVQNNSTAGFTFNSPIPEPGSVVMALIGGCFLWSRSRRN